MNETERVDSDVHAILVIDGNQVELRRVPSRNGYAIRNIHQVFDGVRQCGLMEYKEGRRIQNTLTVLSMSSYLSY